jgi:CubicO group peptidase (beta-lactamase class C family)
MSCRIACSIVLAAVLVSSAGAQTKSSVYYPDRFDWQRRTPQQMEMNAAALDEAVRFAVASESTEPRDQAPTQARSFGAREPHSSLIGPTKVRAALNGLVIRRGYVVAEWGDTKSVDMTHSVTKTFLTTVVGLAWQKGLIRDVNDRVRGYMPPGVDLFDDPQAVCS